MPRPPTGGRRAPGRVGVPGTAARSGTGSRAGAEAGQIANALASQLHVSERPITQHGVAGLKTGVRGPERGVYDKSYYVGILRSKINELRQEIRQMNSKTESFNTDQATYMSATKQAEQIVEELREEQGALSDYNLIVEMLNTGTDMTEISRQTAVLKASNDGEAMELETLFVEKTRKDQQVSEIEAEIEREKQTAQSIVSEMSQDMQRKYQALRATNEEQMKLLENQQREMDEIQTGITQCNEELDQYPMKRKAAKLHQQLIEAEAAKKAATKELERETKESPDEERVRLLEQVRTDNRELASMEKLITELEEKREVLQDELQEIDSKFDDEVDDKLEQFRKLKHQQAKIFSYLSDFPKRLEEEKTKYEQVGANIGAKLESTSRLVESIVIPASEDELVNLEADLSYKADAMVQAGATTEFLEAQLADMKSKSDKFHATEKKLSREEEKLKTKLEQLKKEIEVFKDIDGLNTASVLTQQRLEKKSKLLKSDVLGLKERIRMLKNEIAELRTKLDRNDTHRQLGSWEVQWQQKASNNFTMKEFIESRNSETDYKPLEEGVKAMLDEHNADITAAIHSQLSSNRFSRDY